jgi:hypothetical protein
MNERRDKRFWGFGSRELVASEARRTVAGVPVPRRKVLEIRRSILKKLLARIEHRNTNGDRKKDF